MKNAVYCIAQDSASAESIVDNLRSAGISSGEISVLMADKSGTRDFAHEQNTKLPEGAATGGVAGMGAGAILGWLAGIGSLAIPGVGPFIAAGPIMAALGGLQSVEQLAESSELWSGWEFQNMKQNFTMERFGVETRLFQCTQTTPIK